MTRNDNPLFNLAAEVVNFTQCHLFLTGKAGTGKTTFLKYIKETTHKASIVVAPTGVAAINAGGVTMHSFFQLPFNPYLANESRLFGTSATVDKRQLLGDLRLNREKLEVMNELELLIIDEVSMLRADMLDAIDDVLRYARGKPRLPFGGVQVLFIGDLFQLPPVVSDDEWLLLKDTYQSPFFFSAKVLAENPPLFIELKTIYRQSDQQFISLLNNIRNNQLDETDYQLLQSRYRPAAADEYEGTITLTTHNRVAEQMNRQELEKLDGEPRSFMGKIEGDFSEKALPTDMRLDLKVGAQVMFIRNDTDERKFFNGMLATVTRLDGDSLTVQTLETQTELTVSREKWSNLRYKLNTETGRVEEEEIGSFSQFPLRLAWAITIHKSQGLTFDHVIIDAGASFAAGQVYVALSRCRSLQGIVLLSRILPQSIMSDERIVQYARQENRQTEIESLLAEEKPKFAAAMLLKTFDWTKLCNEVEHFFQSSQNKQVPDAELVQATTRQLVQCATEQKAVADKFCERLQGILAQKPLPEALLQERTTKAKSYFAGLIYSQLIQPVNMVQASLSGKSRVKKYLQQTNRFEDFLWRKLREVERVGFGDASLEVEPIVKTAIAPEPTARKPKQPKGTSHRESFELYKNGHSIEQIATRRALAISTITGHLASFVESGELDAADFVSPPLLDRILAAALSAGDAGSSAIKEELGDDASYHQIRMAVAHFKRSGQLPT